MHSEILPGVAMHTPAAVLILLLALALCPPISTPVVSVTGREVGTRLPSLPNVLVVVEEPEATLRVYMGVGPAVTPDDDLTRALGWGTRCWDEVGRGFFLCLRRFETSSRFWL